MKLHEIIKRTVEPQNIEYRMSKGEIARAAQALAPRVALSFLAKIDRIPYFDVLYSLFDIRYSLFQSFFLDLTGCFSNQRPR